ncbi:protein C19orf12 homolog [Oenanthe melanoleuca]|uniref:protein C19orf12 homolog n=1 Tax=Oenanthe melanoleuca TaxID=2939378 RepID=UPI0024C1E3BF|nr:protein C19orf12 homolog [Oenanthe melanoleuca]
MPSRVDDVMKLLNRVAEERGMMDVWTNCRRGALLTGGSAVVGGLLIGPPGFVVGALVGGLLSWRKSGEFKTAYQILLEFTATERQKLCMEVMAIVTEFDWNDASDLIRLVMKNPTVLKEVTGVLNTHLSNKLKA